MIIHLIDTSGSIRTPVLQAIAAKFRVGDRVIAFDDAVHDLGVIENLARGVAIAWRGRGLADIGRAMEHVHDLEDVTVVCYSDGRFADGYKYQSKALRGSHVHRAGRLRIVTAAEMLTARDIDRSGTTIDASRADRPVRVTLAPGDVRVVRVPDGSVSPVDVLEIYELLTGMLFEANVADPGERLDAAKAVHALIETRMKEAA